MFEPRTRTESMLLKACGLLAEKGDLPVSAVHVAIAQADEETPPAPRLDGRIVTFVQRVAEAHLPQPEDL